LLPPPRFASPPGAGTLVVVNERRPGAPRRGWLPDTVRCPPVRATRGRGPLPCDVAGDRSVLGRLIVHYGGAGPGPLIPLAGMRRAGSQWSSAIAFSSVSGGRGRTASRSPHNPGRACQAGGWPARTTLGDGRRRSASSTPAEGRGRRPGPGTTPDQETRCHRHPGTRQGPLRGCAALRSSLGLRPTLDPSGGDGHGAGQVIGCRGAAPAGPGIRSPWWGGAHGRVAGVNGHAPVGVRRAWRMSGLVARRCADSPRQVAPWRWAVVRRGVVRMAVLLEWVGGLQVADAAGHACVSWARLAFPTRRAWRWRWAL
jgi:hypothetical protein